MIYHITPRREWISAQTAVSYRAASLESEGFIHCSTARQVPAVAQAFYRGGDELVVLAVDVRFLLSEIRWEPPAGTPAKGISPHDLFPHIYGPINFDAIFRVHELSVVTNDVVITPQLPEEN
jgi:uncharacterized protein (DUF952 family)